MLEERRIFLLKLGFFPVTDDFWQGAGYYYAVNENFTWAFRIPAEEQKFMPFSEGTLIEKTDEELKFLTLDLLSNRMYQKSYK